MPHPPRISRRAFSTVFAMSVPAILAAPQARAQTLGATPSLIAVTPRDLYHTLLKTPLEHPYQGYRFEPAAWVGFEELPYPPGIGGIAILLATNGGDLIPLLGAYAVYEDDDAAHAAALRGMESLADQTTHVLPTMIDGHKVEIVVYRTDRERVRSLTPIRNVLVIGYDVIFRSNDDQTEDRADDQSLSHAEELISHLQKIPRRRT